MLSYESRPHSLGNGHSHGGGRSGSMSSIDGTMDSPSADHLSNGLSEKLSPRLHPRTAHRHIWLITGPAGCGKSTVAEYTAKSLNLPYLEGDNVS